MKKSIRLYRILFLLTLASTISITASCSSSETKVTTLNGAFSWVATWGGMNYDSIVDTTTDDEENIYVTGIFKEEMDADPGSGTKTLTANGSSENAFVSKFDKGGKLIWAIAMTMIPTGIAVDSSKNVFLTGSFNQTIDFTPDNPDNGEVTPVGACDGFLIQLSSKGKIEFYDVFHGTTSESEVYPTDIAVNSMDNPIICGNFVHELQFINTLNGDNSTDCFLLKYTSSMVRAWEIGWGSNKEETCTAICLSPLDDIFLTGSFEGNVDFDPGINQEQRSANGVDGYILKLDPNRQFYWVYTWGGINGVVTPLSITVNSSVGTLVCGSFENSVTFDSGTSTTIDSSINDSKDCFFLAVNFNGNYTKHSVWGSQNADIAFNIKCATDDSILIGGSFQLIVDFDPDSEVVEMRSSGLDDAFLCKFSSTYDFEAVATFGAQLNDKIISIVSTGNNNQYIFGSFQRTVDFDTTEKENNISVVGHVDCCMLKLNAENFTN